MLNSFRKERELRINRPVRFAVLAVLMQCCILTGLYAQNITVKGTVTDAQTGEVLPGVNVVLKGTSQGTITNFDGIYQLAVPASGSVITFSFVGYTSQDIPVDGRTQIDVVLESGATLMDEIVVVGYGTARRKDLTGSIASVNSEEISKVPTPNAAEAIKGRLPGVNIITTDGSPDAEVVIRVRGGGSVTQDNSPLFVVDGFIVSSIRDIPSNDIASITVLKDAASTAIYGAQAANGVILVTTKNPKAGKTVVSYNGFAQIKTMPQERKYDVLDPYEYVMMQYEHAILRSESDLRNFERYYGKYADLELYKYKKPTDWQNEMFGQLRLSQSHNLSISGGTDKTKVRLSLSNNNDEGLMLNNGYMRNSADLKLDHNISDRLLLETSVKLMDTRVNGAGTSGSSQLRVRDVVLARPVNGIADELDIDLNNVDSNDDYQSFLLSMTNPVQLVDQDWRQRNTLNFILQSGLTWKPVEGLDLRTTFTTSQSYEERLRYYGPLTSQSRQEGNSLPLGTVNNDQDHSYRWLNTANYAFKDLGNHQLDLMVGHEIYSSGGQGNFVRVENFRESMQPDEMFANLQLGTLDQYSSYVSTNFNRVSFFGRVNYQFMNKYLLTATLRSDASSKFAKENRLGLFPAFAVGWKIKEESFMQTVDFVNELKLRLSYGTTGNDRIDPNAFKLLFEPETNNGPGFGTNAYNVYYTPTASILYNPNLVWETTVNRNLGLDFSLFNYRMSGSLDLYQNTTKDLLLAAYIPPSSGYNSQWDNLGQTTNKGIELALNGNIIKKNDFSLSGNMNFGMNKSRIDDLGGVSEAFYQSNWASTDLKDRDDYYLAVGQTVGLIYGYTSDGIYTEDDFESYDEVTGTYILKEGVPDAKNVLGVASVRPGFMKLADISGDTLIDSRDRGVIGSALPKANGGFGFDATFKGFDLSVLFTWSYGNDIYNTGKIDYNQLYRTTYGNMLNTMNSENRYTYIDVDGSITGTPGAVVTDLEQLRQMNEGKTLWSGSNSFGQATAVITDWAVEDGSFLRLNTLTLGYTIPENITRKIGVSQFRVYATGYNLWLWTKYSGYDPEVSTTRSSSYAALTPGVDYSSYPRSRSFTVGVNVTF
ncbi:MAG: SusC/RagA family TonB-linked outer membrane protein [Bacteroidota bacterium]